MAASSVSCPGSTRQPITQGNAGGLNGRERLTKATPVRGLLGYGFPVEPRPQS